MRILIVTPAQPRTTGNWVSARRQQKGLEALGHDVHIVEAEDSVRKLETETENFAPDVVNILHAYRSGKLWLACEPFDRLPLAVTLTGTDVNHGLAHPEQRPTILTVLTRAEAIITLNGSTTTTLQKDYPGLASRLHHVPPALDPGVDSWGLRDALGLQSDRILFLHPAGIRPVKANLELLEMFGPVAAAQPSGLLVFCGPVLDVDYGRRFLKAVKSHPWAHYAGEIPVTAMPATLREADVVLNNSVSEGFSNALHEAAWVGTPILARNIPGNVAAFEPGRQGLLYDSPQRFMQHAAKLARDPHLRARLSQPNHRVRSLMEEAHQLERIFLTLVSPARS